MKPTILVSLILFSPSAFLSAQIPVSNRSLNYAIVFRAEQDALRGRLVEVGDDTLVLLTAEREARVPLTDVRRIILSFESAGSRGGVYGGLLASYVCAWLFMTPREGGPYISISDGGALWIIPGAAVGTALGYLIDPGGATREEIIDLTGNFDEKRKGRERLLSATTKGRTSMEWTVSIQAAQVSPSLPPLEASRYISSYEDRRISGFNLVRRVYVGYSGFPFIDVGLSLITFGEPARSVFAYEGLAGGGSRNISTTQTFEASARCLIASIQPLDLVAQGPSGLVVGVGGGLSSIEFRRHILVSSWSPAGEFLSQDSDLHHEDSPFAWYLFAEWDVQVFDGLSIGLIVDRVVASSIVAPEVPIAGLPSQTMRFGNSSAGVIVSVQF